MIEFGSGIECVTSDLDKIRATSTALNSLLNSISYQKNAAIIGFDVVVTNIQDKLLEITITPGLAIINTYLVELKDPFKFNLQFTNKQIPNLIISAYLDFSNYTLHFEPLLFDGVLLYDEFGHGNHFGDLFNFPLRLIKLTYSKDQILTIDGMNPIPVYLNEPGHIYATCDFTYSDYIDGAEVNRVTAKSFIPQFTKPEKIFIHDRYYKVPNYGKIINLIFDNLDSYFKNRSRELFFSGIILRRESIWQMLIKDQY